MIICLANHKGGTGKTSISIGLGVYFARQKKRVLTIDMDPQGHIAPGVGLNIEYNDPSIADLFLGKKDIFSIITPTKVERLDIIPSNIRLSMVKETLYNSFKREQKLKKAMNPLFKKMPYDVIIIDCPPALGPLVENALIISDYCIIPCEASSRSIDGLADFIDKIHEVKEGEMDNKWFIVLSRIKKSAKLTNEVIEKKLSGYRKRIINTRIYEKESINQSQIAGIPVFDFPKAKQARENFNQLGEEIYRRCLIKKDN